MLSTIDWSTDIYVTYIFWKDQKKMYYMLSIAMLVGSMVLSLLLVFCQNRKMGTRRVLAEMLVVLVGLKPAVDAFRVGSGHKIMEGQLVDPVTEMNLLKGIEMFAEAIPGVIIQLSAILSDGIASDPAIASLAISALTTGFTSATLSYDYDTDPRKCHFCPQFYGYVPSGSTKRTVLFITMMLLSAIILLVRTLILVLFGLVSKSAALIYICTDIGIYLLFKVLRQDFTYWMPFEGPLSIIMSVIFRIMVKVIVDFTGNVQFRHPYEGNVYSSLSGAFISYHSIFLC